MSNSPAGVDADACCETTSLLREPLTTAAATEMAVKLKALADPVRLRLFSAVATRAGGEACVCDVSDGLDVGQPTISHHLKVLRDAGLLTSQRRASWVYYSVVPEALIGLSAFFAPIDIDVSTEVTL
ncbi:ArsR/SmtB family transcription factor [Mycobacterium sp. SMC-16]|uniref:ArsR/SmtB family transcription factor n=1 Tax=Mycobacteriaceae TaxID=1762 RepID=UPI001BB35E74|nr:MULTISPECIES: metalloregulator ArsR/SmtB family transcription factor [unclassified Mycolicibacterium]